MHSPAAALAWEFWRRHRLGLAAVVALVAVFGAVCAASPVTPTDGFVHSIWFVMGLCYVVGVFAYGFDGRLESAESGFPARLFLLPVRTGVLVGWPMLQGMAAAVGLWLAWDHLVLRPAGVETPPWWPAMLAAVVATSQAVAWLPFGLPWVRVLVAFAVIGTLTRAHVLLALLGGRFADPETQTTVLSVVAAALVPLAFLAAYAGVTRARRGDSPDWSLAWRAARPAAATRPGPRPFRSAVRAQVWYEWRVRGLGFVLTVAFVLVSTTTLYALAEPEAARRPEFAAMLLLIPVCLAPIWSSYAGAAGESVRSAALSAFSATRPLSNPAFVAAKVRAAGLAVAAAWAVALVAVSAWLACTGSYRGWGPVWDAAAAKYGTARVAAFCALQVVGPAVVAWRMMVVGLWTGLTGRSWVIVGQTIVVMFVGLQLMYEWTLWNADVARRERILDALPWAAGVAVGVKFLVAGWALRALHRRGQLRAGVLAGLLGVWLAVAAGLFGLLLWLVLEGLVPAYGLALGVVLAVPLARVAAAPLALAWNRHR